MSDRRATPKVIDLIELFIMATKFFKCETCGNVVVKFVDSGVVPFCCGDEMTELKSGSTDGKFEYHLPVVEQLDDCKVKVRIGAEPHPMTDEHHIMFIYIETEKGGQLRYLKPGDKPEAVFVCKEKLLSVYAYCNKHGLWRTDVDADCKLENRSCKSDSDRQCCFFG